MIHGREETFTGAITLNAYILSTYIQYLRSTQSALGMFKT